MEQTQSNISVIIPTFNRREFITRALQSVSHQTLQPSEIIVVDDGSTDGTAELITNNYPHVLFLSQKHSGVSAARNKGIKYSNFEWIAFLDSDDEWLPHKLEYQINTLFKNNTSICHTDEIWFRNGEILNQKKIHKKSGGYIFDKCLERCLISPSSSIIHRNVFLDCGLFDENFPACEDYDLWLRITSKYNVDFIKEPLIHKHGGHADQLSNKYWGLDRFRVESMEKILFSDNLDDYQIHNTLNILLDKISILINGAQKRRKFDMAIEYTKKYDKYNRMLRHI